jgi:hypothetical protein
MLAKHIKVDFEGFLEGAKKIQAPLKNPTKSPIMCFTSMQKNNHCIALGWLFAIDPGKCNDKEAERGERRMGCEMWGIPGPTMTTYPCVVSPPLPPPPSQKGAGQGA